MIIDGVSQSTGAERLVEIGPADAGIRVTIRARKENAELGFVDISPDALMSVLTDQPAGPQSIAGTCGAEERVFEVEVCRNEVLLSVATADAAVGLDDLMDALAGALPAS